jgi:hypothetical protein
MLKLNLGSGQNPKAGYVNVDKFDAFGPDIVCDLEVVPWPIESNCAEEVSMNHVLEHLGAQADVFFGVMQELYRVCAPGAVVHIAVPHQRSDAYAADPTHVRPINQHILQLFSKKMNREWQAIGAPNTPLATYLDVDFEIRSHSYSLTPYWFQKYTSGELKDEDIEFAVSTYFNVVDEVRIDLVAIK